MNEIIVDESAITSPEELEAFFLNALETDARISPITCSAARRGS